jgi:hypothetical protein
MRNILGKQPRATQQFFLTGRRRDRAEELQNPKSEDVAIEFLGVLA